MYTEDYAIIKTAIIMETLKRLLQILNAAAALYIICFTSYATITLCKALARLYLYNNLTYFHCMYHVDDTYAHLCSYYYWRLTQPLNYHKQINLLKSVCESGWVAWGKYWLISNLVQWGRLLLRSSVKVNISPQTDVFQKLNMFHQILLNFLRLPFPILYKIMACHKRAT